MDGQELQDGQGDMAPLLYPVYPVHRCLNLFSLATGLAFGGTGSVPSAGHRIG